VPPGPASPADETRANLDSAVVDAAIEGFAGTAKPYIHISGLWIYGENTSISEGSPLEPQAMVAWKEPIERRILDAPDVRGAVIVSSVAYGDDGGGIPGLLLNSPRDGAGHLIMLGTGRQHWSTVHVADLARCFRRVLESDSARGRYVVGNGLNPSVAELTEARRSQPALPERSPGPTMRLGHVWATTSPKSCCSIRAPSRPRLGTSSAGLRPIQDWSTTSATGATHLSSEPPDRRPGGSPATRWWSRTANARESRRQMTREARSSQTDQVVAGERPAELLHLSALAKPTKVNHEVAGVVEQPAHLRFGVGVVSG
jgi:hypothetical protein